MKRKNNNFMRYEKGAINCHRVICRTIIFLYLVIPVAFSQIKKPVKPLILENITWVEAEKALKKYEAVLVALGARTKEHGPHLRRKGLTRDPKGQGTYMKDDPNS